MAHSGSLESTSNRNARCQVAFFLFFGMSHVLTYMLLKTLGLWLTGYWNVVIFSLTLSLTSTAMTWPIYSVPVTGYPLLMTPLFPGGSPLVLEWRPIRSFLPKLKWGFWQEVARSPFDCYRRMNKWYSWRKHTLELAITRARSLCLIMGPLDMKGLLGAATVMGTLTYGAGHVWEGQAHFYLHDGELSRSPPDETFIHMLQQNCSLTGPHFPPPAIVEALQDYVTRYYKVRRLHLIVVDLWRPWKYNTARAKAITDQLWYISHCADTHRVSPFRPDGPEPPLRCRRFAYGYALDGSECPSYLVWPQRGGHSYVLLDTSTNDTLPLNQEFFRPLGMEHFYDSFALESQISVRREALRLFGLREDELLPDLHITRDGVLRIRLGAHQEHQVNHVARATDRTKVSAAVIQLASHEEDTAPQQDMRVMPVTLTEVKVQVTRNRMTLRLRWWPMLNNMSSCNVLMLRWVKTSLAKMILLGLSTASSWNWRWFQRDGHWLGYLSRCRHVLITSTACWRDAAGKYKPHVLHPLNHLPPCTRWRNVWPWSWLSTWPKRLPPFSERFWHMRPRSCTTTVRCIYFAPITGYSRFTRNYCTHRPDAMLPGLARVTAYAKPPKQRRPSASGTSFSDWIGGTWHADTLQVWFFGHWAPVVLQQLQKKEDRYRAENPSWMDEEVARQLSGWLLGEQHPAANRHH